MKLGLQESWFHPHLEVCQSRFHGRGIFARSAIAAGEVVMIWTHQVVDAAEAPNFMLRDGELYARRDGTCVWLPLGNSQQDEDFLNHSCDPNVWMEDEVTLSARRDIHAGEELFSDYALWELDPEWVCPWRCQCESLLCRKVVTGRDWELPELQLRYGGHFHPVLLERMSEVEPR